MADSSFLSTSRYAVVTGANKGIGLEICRQLASNGVNVVLTSRDERRGIEALENLKRQFNSLSRLLEFHQLDVADASTVASLLDFVRSKFGKLDILVNNAGILGSDTNSAEFVAYFNRSPVKLTEKYELAVECLNTNYYGAKRLVETFLPLLRLSDSPRIVNLSSGMGRLMTIPNERVRVILGDIKSVTEEKIDEIIHEFLEDLKIGELKTKGWPTFLAPYMVSKVVINAYTRILAKRHPYIDINCVCPGYVKTDINYNAGYLSPEEGAESPVRLALLHKGEVSGSFFDQKKPVPFE